MPELQDIDTARGAQEFGITAAYDFGPQRMFWVISLFTHWQGDDGFLKRVYCELRQPNQLMDTTWLKGHVESRETQGGEHLVDIEFRGENQLGMVTTRGHATVALPFRGT